MKLYKDFKMIHIFYKYISFRKSENYVPPLFFEKAGGGGAGGSK